MPVVRTLLSVVSLIVLAPAAIGQTAAGQDTLGPIAALRELDSLNDEQNRTVRAWVDQHMMQLSGDDALQAATAVSNLRTAASTAKPAFRETFVSACTEAARDRYKSAGLQPAARMLALLASLNEASTTPVLIEALKDERVAVRTAAAVGLRNVRPKVALAGGSYFTESVAGLREAGKKETSAPTLNYGETGTPPDARAVVAALLEILDGRAELYNKGEVQGESAEIAGIRTVAATAKLMNEDEKKRAIAAGGKVLKGAALLYIRDYINVKDAGSSPQMVEQRDACEALVELTEKLLLDLTRAKIDAKSTVTVGMKSGDDVKMRTALGEWVNVLDKAVGLKLTIEDGGG
jgi:hypothetical protein